MEAKEKNVGFLILVGLGLLAILGGGTVATVAVVENMILTANQKQFLPLILQFATEFGIDPFIFAGLIQQESNFDPNALRLEPAYSYGTNPDYPTGDASYGLVQILYSTAVGLGYSGDPSGLLDPGTNIYYGAMLLAQNYKRFGDYPDAISAYNSGQPLSSAPASTVNNYVPKVTAYAAAFQTGNAFA